MVGMRELATHIIAVANESGKKITNLQLQKIMFFIFGKMVKNSGDDAFIESLYNYKFRRWSYGPVVEEIYFDYNNFGGRPINEEEATKTNIFTEYDSDIEKLLSVNPFKMVEITHSLPSWADYKDDIEARNYVPPYDINDFIREFRRDGR